MPMSGENRPDSRLKRYLGIWCGPVLIAMVFFGLTLWTWRKWPDILIDFGQELYVPWQLVDGKVLYRDLAFFNGPFSPYLNALWFRIFGVSLTTIIFCNLAITACLTSIIYWVVKTSSDRYTAASACIVFLCTFAFGHIAFVGNYNYICPYSHELTHGILLAFLLIILLSRSIRRPQVAGIILAGLCLGLIFLGKGETFLGAAGAAIVGLVLLGAANELPGRKYFYLVVIFIISLLIPVAIFLGYFTFKMPLAQALRGIAGTWAGLLGSDVSKLLFFQVGSGFDRPWQNLWRMIMQFLGIGLVAGPFIIAGFFPKHFRPFSLIFGLVAMLCLGVILLARFSAPFLLFNRSLPLSMLAATGLIIVLVLKNRRDKDAIVGLAPLAMWAALGLGLLAKIILHARIWQYGFALAMPAAIFLVAVMVGIIPELLQRRHGRGHWFRLFAGLIIFLDVAISLKYSYSHYSKKDLVIGEHGDVIITYGAQASPRGPAVSQLIHFIHSVIPPDATFNVLPEGIMINYLTRHVASTRYINFMPTELIIYGETSILRAFKNQAADFIILVHKDTREFGLDFFGINPVYGKATMDWIRLHYTSVWQDLADPLQDDHFGIKVMQRKNTFSGNGTEPESALSDWESLKSFAYERLHIKGN
jgi:hypothetical protein